MSGGGIQTIVELLGDEIATLRADHDEAVQQRDAVRATLDRVTGERDLLNAVVAKHLGLLGDALGSTVHREGDVVLVGPTVAAAIACVEALEKQRDEARARIAEVEVERDAALSTLAKARDSAKDGLAAALSCEMRLPADVLNRIRTAWASVKGDH